jgi:restriction system protein
MNGIEFENWVADLFRRGGFQVESTQASGDHGVDLWVSRNHCLSIVQCKRWDSAVGEPILRDLYGAMMSANAKSGCLVTTGSFTAQAQRFAHGRPLCLIGWDSLMEAARSPETLVEMVR